MLCPSFCLLLTRHLPVLANRCVPSHASHLAAASFLLVQNRGAACAEVLKAVSSFQVTREAYTCNTLGSQHGLFLGGLSWGWSGFALFYLLKKKKKILRFSGFCLFVFIPFEIYSLMRVINLVLFYSKCLKSKFLLVMSAPRALQELSTVP